MRNVLFILLILISISCTKSEHQDDYLTDTSVCYTLSVTNGDNTKLWLSFMGNKLSPGETSPDFEVTNEKALIRLRWDNKPYDDAITLKWDTVYVDMKNGSVKNVVLKNEYPNK